MEDGQRSVQQLLHPAAEDLLARLRPMAIAQEQAGAAQANKGLWAGPRYTTHPLVREVAAEMLASRSPEERMHACRAFVCFMLSCGEDMESVVRIGSGGQTIAQELLSMELVDIRELARLLAELACKILSPQHPRPLVGLAALLWDLGQLNAAAELAQATLKALEPNHSELSFARTQLKHISHASTPDQAEKLARNALDYLNASLGEKHADTVSARENLALTLLQQELWDDHATMFYKSALMKSANCLCFPFLHVVKVAKAAVWLGRARKLSGSRPFMDDHGDLDTVNAAKQARPGVAHVWSGLACKDGEEDSDVMPLSCQGKVELPTMLQSPSAAAPSLAFRELAFREDDEVGKLQWAVLQAREAALGLEHLDTIFAQANMAATLRQRGRLTEAAELLRGVVAAQARVLGLGHPETKRMHAELERLNRTRGWGR